MYTTAWLAAAIASFSTTAFARIDDNVSYQEFEQLVKSNSKSLVLFSSQSTSALRHFTSILKSVERASSIPFITIDCDVESDLCGEYDVNSYPTVRLYEHSGHEREMSITRYRGPRTAKAISNWVKRMEMGVVTNVDEMGLENFKQLNDVVVVAHLPSDDKSLLDKYTAVAAQQHHEYVFGYTRDPSVAQDQDLVVPSVQVFKNTDNEHRIFSGGFTSASLSSFLATAIPSTIRTFREKDLETFMQRDKLTLYIFMPLDSPRATMLRQQLTPLAKKYEKYVTFAMADAVKHAEMASNFRTRFYEIDKDEEVKSSVVVHAPLNDHVFMYAPGKKLNAESVEDMLKTILQGKARSGDVFGKSAEDLDEETRYGHDEL